MRVIPLHAPPLLTYQITQKQQYQYRPKHCTSTSNAHPIISYPHTVSPNTAILSHHITGMTNTRAYTQKKFGPCIIFKL